MPVDANTSYDNQSFYEWRGVAEYWLKREDSFDQDFPSLPHDDTTQSLAAHIVTNVFKLSLTNDSEQYGSYLAGYDVKNRDAYQMIQLSLAAELGNVDNPRFIECYSNEEGVIKFYLIGENASAISSNILYSISTGELRQQCDNVIVFGYDPPPKRLVRGENGSTEIGYDMFTFFDTYGRDAEAGLDDDYRDLEPQGSYPLYWVWSDYLDPEACDYKREGYIEYGNPHFGEPRYIAGPDKVYDPDQFEEIIGYMYKIHIPWYVQGSTRVEFREKSTRYIRIDDLGKLQKVNWQPSLWYKSTYCTQETDLDDDTGVMLPRSNEGKFLGVSAVYIYGYRLKQIDVDEYVDTDTNLSTNGPADFIVDLDSMALEPIQLSEGEDYIIAPDPLHDGYWRIVFMCNISPNYIDKYGGRVLSEGGLAENVYIRVAKTSIYVNNPEATSVEDLDYSCTGGRFGVDWCEGILRDGKTQINNRTTYNVAIFPTGEGTSGYAIPSQGRVVVVYEWDNPCVAFFDLENNITSANLQNVEIDFFPIIMKDPPQYVSRNGIALDPSQQLPDFDITSVQDLTDSEYSRSMNELENADIKVSLPFLNQEGCNKMSEMILDLQNDTIESTTYVCDPDAEPVLGELVDGKVINSIDYSYQDSSQYLISVQAGPKWQGIGGWDNSIYQNTTDRLQLEGIVRYVYEDNIKCIVQLEQIGLLECINGQTQPLEVGDNVKVTVYNNPVSR